MPLHASRLPSCTTGLHSPVFTSSIPCILCHPVVSLCPILHPLRGSVYPCTPFSIPYVIVLPLSMCPSASPCMFVPACAPCNLIGRGFPSQPITLQYCTNLINISRLRPPPPPQPIRLLGCNRLIYLKYLLFSHTLLKILALPGLDEIADSFRSPNDQLSKGTSYTVFIVSTTLFSFHLDCEIKHEWCE